MESSPQQTPHPQENERRFDVDKLKDSTETPLFIIDLFMVLLVIINLNWIIFDSLFDVSWFYASLNYLLPTFTQFYASKIHDNFFEYDLFFVAIFITELLFRWAVAIHRQTYHRWFFYPFAHWYDVLGCIPIGSLRFLRILRVVSIVYRLQKLGIIDIRNNPLYPLVEKYINIIVEELSDRVVINVLEGVQREVRSGNPIVGKINDEVIQPKLDGLIDTIDKDLGDALRHVLYDNEAEIKDYLTALVAEQLGVSDKRSEILNKPLMGMSRQLGHGVLFEVIRRFVDDLGKSDHSQLKALLGHLGQSLKEQHLESLTEQLTLTVIEVIEKIKESVSVQQWKLQEVEEQTAKPIRD